MRIAFLGLPLAALLLLHDGHSVVLAGLRQGLTSGARRLRRRIGSDAVVIDPHRDWQAFTGRIRCASPDLLVSWFFTRRIPMQAVHACRLGGIGVHPSLLPRHRGPDPFFAAIDAGDAVTGVTVHRIEAEYDTGAILSQQPLAVNPSWNAWQLARGLDRPSLRALRETVAKAAMGDPLIGEPQDESLATEAPEPGEQQQALQWDQPTEKIVRRIRALAPFPGAETTVGETLLRVTEARAASCTPLALLIGEAAILDDTAVVRTADGAVALLRGEVGEQQLDALGIAKLVARHAQKR